MRPGDQPALPMPHTNDEVDMRGLRVSARVVLPRLVALIGVFWSAPPEAQAENRWIKPVLLGTETDAAVIARSDLDGDGTQPSSICSDW